MQIGKLSGKFLYNGFKGGEMDYKDKYELEFEKEVEELKKNTPNLMLIGVSGAGKSSLINKIFGRNVAEVGTGLPITDRIERYTSETSRINIFDTLGYEVKGENQSQNTFESKVVTEIERRATLPLSEQIHIIWYCIPVTNHRIFSYDIDNINNLKQTGVPFFIAITKCDEDSLDENENGITAEAFKKTLEKAGISRNLAFEVSSLPDLNLDLDDLINRSANSLKDSNLKEAFIQAQLHNLSLKSDEAAKTIHLCSAAAVAVAANPLPVSDAPAIIAIQMGMAIKLAKIYGFGAIGESATALLKTQIVSMAAKQLAASLTKFVPIFGSVINAAVAASFTEGLGWGLVTVYKNVLEEYLKTGKEPQWAMIFSSNILINILQNKYK